MKANKIITIILLMLLAFGSYAQSLIMVKAYDKNMRPISNLGLSLDGAPYQTTDDQGSMYMEIEEHQLPPKAITVNRQDLETESWNYSKGVLEVIIRQKSYRLTTMLIEDTDGMPLAGTKVSLNIAEPLIRTTNQQGRFTIPVPLTVDVITTTLLEVPGYNIRERRPNKNIIVLTVQPILLTKTLETHKPYEDTFDLTELDSIQSLTVFYGFIKNLDIQKLNSELRTRIDDKFYQLMSQQNDTLGLFVSQSPIGRISDSSLVTEDISLLILQAQQEEAALSQLKFAFDEKIALISSKLVGGGANLDPQSRQDLLNKLEELDAILTANSIYFSSTWGEYHDILNSMRNQLLNIKDLERQLTDVQKERLEERKSFRNRLFIISMVLLGLALISFILLFLLRKINRQKKQIDLAHKDLNEVNEHLEELVLRRTEMLKKTNEELDIFMYRSSHDLRRPITSILGLVQIAKMTVKGEALDLFKRVASTARSMDRMLQKLIMVSHINQPSEHIAIRLETLPEKYQEHFNGLIDKNDINLDWDIEKGLTHYTCPVMLDIILSNLLENSLRFSALGESQIKPPVLVRFYNLESDLILEVEDNAGGIDARVQPKIWNMFYVGNEGSKGNGLGLYVTRRAVAKLNADISFTCEGKKTIFKVRIPSGKIKHMDIPDLMAV